MQSLQLVGAIPVFVVMLCVGTIAHELSHAAVLHVLGIPFVIEWGPRGDHEDTLSSGAVSTLATVRPHPVSHEFPAWALQCAAIAPVVLTVPVILMAIGVLPDPLATGGLLQITAMVTWLGCALPSPQDFSVLWHADDAVERLSRS